MCGQSGNGDKRGRKAGAGWEGGVVVYINLVSGFFLYVAAWFWASATEMWP